MMDCKKCQYLAFVEDDEMCTHMKCVATSIRGKTISWSMTHVFGHDGRERDLNAYFNGVLERRSTPKWCPSKEVR